MLNIKFILENEVKIRQSLINRNNDLDKFEKILELGKKRGAIMSHAQSLSAQLAKLSKEFGIYKNDKSAIDKLKKEIAQVKEIQNQANAEANELNSQITELLSYIPNLPLDEIPVGKDELMNKVIKTYDHLGRGLVSGKKPHYEIAKELDLFDLERAVKMSGSRFVLYKNKGAKLVRALMNFMLDLHETKGYEEILPPVLVKDKMLFGTGQLPKFKEDLFFLESSNLYLIPTAEVPLTNIYNDEIVDLSKPLAFTAFTECFRSEAGSSGKDTRGIIRNHQFKKVELVKITSEQDAISEYEKMVEDAKDVLVKLEIPFRELLLCTGDLGFSARKTIDLELWLPSEIKYREVSSISYMGDFQARRGMIRYRDQNNATQYAHTMNGSGLAIDRIIASILENYQNEDGSITVPKVLIPYMNGLEVIK
ncbi:serine--tRNA ligase [Mycoplasmopsis alligatoris]|uniref:Serine--tRNA ligase n=1 Tax=Mycoplasmopsis alligatoris A21JP2 TaxID=747682 RepID=D4XWK4_9BACT|nr:serine--tRNA ligase [Mycoplasmopsis alligatoris]EFF41227.1 serine--tRNA ligase [Mycoplasmopsis alligatoris A21JP2]